MSGQVVGKPIAAGVKSSLPPLPVSGVSSKRVTVSSHVRSGPPHALQIVAMRLVPALAIFAAAFWAGLPIAAAPFGHVSVCLPAARASQHCRVLCSLATAKRAVAAPIAR